MFALDTNVISETMREAPNPAVMAWLESVPRDSIFLPSVVVAELHAGTELLPAGRRRSFLETAIRDFIAGVGPSNIIDFTLAEAVHYARILAERQRLGRRIAIADAQVAACAASRGIAVVTRNVSHFEKCGVAIINPWEAR